MSTSKRYQRYVSGSGSWEERRHKWHSEFFKALRSRDNLEVHAYVKITHCADCYRKYKREYMAERRGLFKQLGISGQAL